MIKRVQDKVARSKLALPVTAVYAIGIWILCGGLREYWVIQGGCFALSALFMALLNNTNSLIRIYSRLVSSSFLILLCCACFLFPSMRGAILEAGFAGFLLVLFMTYQEECPVGLTYYAYLMLGIASLAFVQVLYFVPLLWLLTATQLQSLSLRTIFASLFGLLTPYWFGSCWLLWHGDVSLFANHLKALLDLHQAFNYSILSINQIAFFALLLIMTIIGIVHFIRKHRDDKIRVRLIYGFFIWLQLATFLFLAFQPQHFNFLIHIAIICTAPLIAHFLALTSTKWTNIAFFVLTGITLILTVYNLWTYSSLF